MLNQFILKITAPMILTSLLLVVLGVVTAWNVQYLYLDHSGEANLRASIAIGQTLPWLSVCGGVAGLVAGIVIARHIKQSFVQLDVSVRGAADRLRDVVGPVTISQRGGLKELESGLRQVESQITTVVERLQQRELEVLRSDQLAAVGQLAAGVAHELRNPLMPMKMLVQAAVERNDGIGLCGRPLLIVEEEIRRMERAIQEFLDFARPPTLEVEPFELQTVVEQTIELVSGRAERQEVDIATDLPLKAVVIKADATQIRQVLLNLLLNAIDALQDGGRIDIQIANMSPPVDHPRTRSSANWIGIVVRDNGPGLAPEIEPRLFEPFVSSKETGTGLGLSICQRIIEAHNGIIEACNQPGGGAEFSIYLPVEKSTAGGNPVAELERLALLSTS